MKKVKNTRKHHTLTANSRLIRVVLTLKALVKDHSYVPPTFVNNLEEISNGLNQMHKE